jgi:hypothetical protein
MLMAPSKIAQTPEGALVWDEETRRARSWSAYNKPALGPLGDSLEDFT